MTQTATVVYRARYEREQVIAMLTEAGESAEALALMTNTELGTKLADVASMDDNFNSKNSLYERMVDAAGDAEETIDSEDWELTEVYPPAS